MANILVTGAGGFIGRALTTAQDKEDLVVSLGHDLRKKIPIPGDVIIQGDVRDYSLMCRIISQYEIDTVYHLAAQSIVRKCANDPVTAYDINVMGTIKLLEAVRNVGSQVKSVVVSTSDKAFGHTLPPYTEESPLAPRYAYETTKSCQDLVCQNYMYNYSLPVRVLRCANIYGPGDPNDSRLIPNSIRRICKGEKPVVYSGVASYKREFVYIDDAVRAFNMASDFPVGVYCVGGTTGPISVLDLVGKIMSLMGVSGDPDILDRPALFKEIESQYIDASKIKKFGWSPEVSLEEGLLKTIQYYCPEGK